jgi:hypothetical protein
MNLLFAVLFYAATAILVGGIAYRVYEYARTPAPLKIPTTPAPTTSGGVAFRMFREVVFFESLFKSNLWIWALGWTVPPRPRPGAAAPPALLHRAGKFHHRLHPALRHVRRLRHGRRPRRALGATLPGRAHPLHLDPLRPPDAGPAARHRRHRTADEVCHAHRHRRREDLLPRPDGVRNQPAAGAPRPLPASGHGRAADDHLPGQQAAARTRRVLLADPQPGRQPARNAPPGALGRQLDTKN